MRLLCCFALLLACASPVLAGQAVGVTFVNVGNKNEVRPLALSIWYPTAGGGTLEEVGRNAVFLGTPGERDAAVKRGAFPLVLVSHGGLRSAANSGAWLCAALARAGFIVIEINGPRPRTARIAVNEIWRRPEDVSRALDVVLGNPAWSRHVDQTRISVVGFALGGTAALALAGGAFEPQSYIRSCDGGRNGPDCAWYRAQGVGLDTVDRTQMARSWRDPRIASAVAIAPEYMDVFRGGAPSPDIPSLIVALGSDSDTKDEGLLAHAVIGGATTADGLPPCTQAGPSILSEDGGEPGICGPSRDTRTRIHDSITDRTLSFLTATTGETTIKPRH